MTLEEHIKIIVEPIITVYPDVAPLEAELPYCTYQRFGGRPITFVEGSLPNQKNAVIQLNCWASNVIEASKLILEVEKAFLASDLTAKAVTEASSAFTDEPNTTLKGRVQDFSIWYPID